MEADLAAGLGILLLARIGVAIGIGIALAIWIGIKKTHVSVFAAIARGTPEQHGFDPDPDGDPEQAECSPLDPPRPAPLRENNIFGLNIQTNEVSA